LNRSPIQPASPAQVQTSSGSQAPARAQPPLAVLLEYFQSEDQRRDFVRAIFDRTARDYDRVERLMSLGTGAWYRRQALLRAGLEPGMRVLDVATGTGLVAREAIGIVGDRGAVLGLDPSTGMMQGLRESLGIALVQARAERLPVADGAFDFLSMGFALRHVADLTAVFREYRRVLRPGGIVCILELTQPERAWSRYLLKLYLRGLVPALSRVVARDPQTPRLFRYFWDTIEACVPPTRVVQALEAAGFEDVRRHVEARVFSEYTARR
jgi:demethylmenaquinone methyltransferase/2-methoxy-6-polyprenyl-1,4-benzoquinol methylase